MKIILIVFFITIAYIVGMSKFEQYMSIDNLKYSSNYQSVSPSNQGSSSASSKVTIKLLGEVNSSKTLNVESGITLGEVIELCGGLKISADMRSINTSYVIETSKDIYIPNLNIGVTKININEATIDELVKLPKIGQVYAQRIIEYRDKIGKYMCLEELMDIQGIGTAIFDAIKDYIIL